MESLSTSRRDPVSTLPAASWKLISTRELSTSGAKSEVSFVSQVTVILNKSFRNDSVSSYGNNSNSIYECVYNACVFLCFVGTTMDYFIVYTTTQKLVASDPSEPIVACLPTKNFYWCSSSNFVFSSLPCVTDAQARQLVDMSCLFSGEFDTVLIESNDPPTVIDAAAGIILPPKHMTELDRLAATVREIDSTCSAVPRGALKYTPLNQVCVNEAFRGLKRDEAFQLNGWVHFRPVQNQKQKDLIARQEAVFSDNFLDEVCDDKPNFCWSIIKDTT